MSTGRLADKVALVTGAARGTGELVARRFVAEGARVVLGDVLEAEAGAVAKDLGDAACALRLDVTSEEDWQAAIETTNERFGGLDVLVNNAAILHLEALVDTPPERFQALLQVNLYGPFLGIRAAAGAMTERGGGSIVNVCSVDGVQGKNGVAAYASSKWGLRGLTRVAAVELGRAGIRVNTVCPEAGSTHMIGPYVPEGVDPGIVHGFGQPFLPYQRERTNDERLGDIVSMILFLASDESRSSTGSDFLVDSGNTQLKRVKGAPGA
ncbi:MAG: SDR family oxidoreductase [Myxococcota bacterium]|nr:SDR family oxidoreductase [Myxococcota bacterium]